MENHDHEAVSQTISGNRNAFERLVKRYSPALSALAYDRLGIVQEAQDAVQETFTAAFRQLRELRDGNAFAAWVYGILRRRCAMRIRQRGTDRRAIEVLAQKCAGEVELTPLEKLVENERKNRIRKAVEKLSPPLREAIVLRYIGGTGRTEAAGLLEISLDALDKRIERALRELREELKE